MKQIYVYQTDWICSYIFKNSGLDYRLFLKFNFQLPSFSECVLILDINEYSGIWLSLGNTDRRLKPSTSVKRNNKLRNFFFLNVSMFSASNEKKLYLRYSYNLFWILSGYFIGVRFLKGCVDQSLRLCYFRGGGYIYIFYCWISTNQINRCVVYVKINYIIYKGVFYHLKKRNIWLDTGQ